MGNFTLQLLGVWPHHRRRLSGVPPSPRRVALVLSYARTPRSNARELMPYPQTEGATPTSARISP